MRFFDLHCDTPYKMYTENQGFYNNNLAVSGKNGEAFDSWYQTFAIWLPEDLENPFEFYKSVITHLKQNLNGNVKPIFAVEGGAVLENDSDRLYSLKKDGIKLLTLTWNGENAIAGGSKSEKGLTAFGKTVIDKMNNINMAVDVSHLNDKSFFKVIERAEKPLASHSNCRKICNHPRNLSDTQIKLICEKGGIIGLNFYSLFLGDDVYEQIYRNIYHLCDIGYENNIALGSDFDGADMANELYDITKIPNLYALLETKGLNNILLDKIFYKNAYLTFDKWGLL